MTVPIDPTTFRSELRLPAMRGFASAVLAICFVASAGTAFAQYGPGPAGTLPGTSMANKPIVGAPRLAPGIPNAEIFGDTNEERLYGKPYNNEYLRPEVVRPGRGESATRRAIEGRPDLGGISADLYAREGPSAIGGSAITRGKSRGTRLSPSTPGLRDHPARNGRAIIRR